MLKIALAAFGVMTLAASPVAAAPCRGAHGKFIKCPSAATKKPVRCRDAKGKFAKCDAAGVKPA